MLFEEREQPRLVVGGHGAGHARADPAPWRVPRGSGRLPLNELDLQIERHFVAHRDAARFERMHRDHGGLVVDSTGLALRTPTMVDPRTFGPLVVRVAELAKTLQRQATAYR